MVAVADPFVQTSFLSYFFYQFLQDTLDTLFGILDESSQRYGLKVFDSLVSKWSYDDVVLVLFVFSVPYFSCISLNPTQKTETPTNC